MLTNKTDISLAMAVWLASDTYDHNSDPNTISVTSLLKPIKSIVLGMKIKDRTVDVADLIAAQMGTSFHTALEVAWRDHYKEAMLKLGYPQSVIDKIKINPDNPKDCVPVYLEQRSTQSMGKWKISGKFDMVVEGGLRDLKSCGTYNYISGSNNTKYIQQGSIYRWLNQDIVTSDILHIEYLFTDWSKQKAMQNSDYPQKRILTKKFTLMSLEETEQFIKHKLSEIEQCLAAEGQANMPMCTPEELWEKPTTYAYYKKPGGSRSTKNFDSHAEATTRLVADGSVGEIITRKGEVVFCRYCASSSICQQAEIYISDGRLVL